MTQGIEDRPRTHQRGTTPLRRSRPAAAMTLLGGSRWSVRFFWKFLIASAATVLQPGPGPAMVFLVLATTPDFLTHWTHHRDLGPAPGPTERPPAPVAEPPPAREPTTLSTPVPLTEVTCTVLLIRTIAVGPRPQTWATLVQIRDSHPLPRAASCPNTPPLNPGEPRLLAG